MNNLFIRHNATIKEALSQMNEIDTKLLIVVGNDEKYHSLLSVGDIQRSLIKNQDFNLVLSAIPFRENYVGYVDGDINEIKEAMLEKRMEFVPILDDDKNVKDIIFWKQLFNHNIHNGTSPVDLPVIIMAGGEGKRLRPFTYIIPKPLMPINEKPIIQHIIEGFCEAGCNNFYLTVNYKASAIQLFFDELEGKKYTVDFIKEEKPLGTAGSLMLLKEKIHKTFVVTNCDIIIQESIKNIYEYHLDKKNELTCVAFIKENNLPYGVFDIDKDFQIKSVVEKPTNIYYVNAGLYILEPHLLNEIPENEFFHITDLIDKVIKRKGKVGLFPINEGSWLDIGEWDQFNKTTHKLKRK